MNRKKIIVLLVLMMLFPGIWALEMSNHVIVTTTKTTYEYVPEEGRYIKKEDVNESESTESEVTEEVKEENLKISRTKSVSSSIGYFMPLDTSWAELVLPVVSFSVTYTTPQAMFGNSDAGFSTSVRLSYQFEKERGVNLYRNHSLIFSLPLNINVTIAGGQSLKFSAGPYFSLSFINEKDEYAENKTFRTSSSFGLQALTAFSYEVSPSWTLDFEINSFIPFVNKTYINFGISAGVSYRF